MKCGSEINNVNLARCHWLMPVILATWEADTGRIKVRGQPGHIVLGTPLYLQNINSEMD
jgi:hypothetical protein